MREIKYRVGIVDYGIGNKSSLKYTIKKSGFSTIITSSREELSSCDALILPGVGAFPTAMQNLRDTALDEYLRKAAMKDKPILGICLGMQLLAKDSQENGETKGLGLLPGKVKPLGDNKWHIGWNSIKTQNNLQTILKEDKDYYYFNHSYMMECDESIVEGYAYLPKRIVAAVRQNNIAGLQFHPEKSQNGGRNLLKRLLEDLINA